MGYILVQLLFLKRAQLFFISIYFESQLKQHIYDNFISLCANITLFPVLPHAWYKMECFKILQ